MAATANYLQRGEALDYKNTTDERIPAGVILSFGDRVGVTGCPIPPGKIGTLHVSGVFEIAKTGSSEIEMGKTVYFDGTGISTEGTAPIGYAAAPSSAADTTVLVKLLG